LPLVPLIQGRRARGDQAGAGDRVQHRKDVPGAPVAEKVAHSRAHQDEPGDARFGELDIVFHEATVTPAAASSAAGRRTCRNTRIASTTPHAMVTAPTATWATVKATIIAIGCAASAVAIRLR